MARVKKYGFQAWLARPRKRNKFRLDYEQDYWGPRGFQVVKKP